MQPGDCMPEEGCGRRHPEWRVELLETCGSGRRKLVCCPRRIRFLLKPIRTPRTQRPRRCLNSDGRQPHRMTRSWDRAIGKDTEVLKPSITEAVIKYTRKVDDEEARENMRIQKGEAVKRGSPAAKHQKQIAHSQQVNQENRETVAALGASTMIGSRSASSCVLSCSSLPACNSADPYRTADGSCNNLINPNVGKSFTAKERLALPQCGPDNSPRTTGKAGTALPNVRDLSVKIMSSASELSGDFTIAVMQWGQFIDHDIVQTTGTTGRNGSVAPCCGGPSTTMCFPITIPDNDPWFNQENQGCMEFRRSAFARPRDCRTPLYRRTGNALTHFIDASNVYGSTDEDASALRDVDGLLKTNNNLLPPDADACTNPSDSQQTCFKAGDNRVNEQPYLTVMHTLFLREHNRIATLFKIKYPQWSSDKIYQESRRIIGALMQHITYNEFLPIILGNHYMELNQMDIRSGYSVLDYDSKVEPSIVNAFSTAAFRMGHSLITKNIRKVNSSCAVLSSSLLHENTHPYILYGASGVPQLSYSQVCNPTESVDNHFTDEVTNRLFETGGPVRDGFDLVAINLQRGRDHCLPPYNTMREVCGLTAFSSFEDWKPHNILSTQKFSELAALYHNDISDVDLYIGGLLETPVNPGGSHRTPIVGPLFQCIIGNQFDRLKIGDRFWYENQGQAGSFTPAQLEDIKKVSLAQIMCLHSENQVPEIQRHAMHQQSPQNPQVSCSSIAADHITLLNW